MKGIEESLKKEEVIKVLKDLKAPLKKISDKISQTLVGDYLFLIEHSKDKNEIPKFIREYKKNYEYCKLNNLNINDLQKDYKKIIKKYKLNE